MSTDDSLPSLQDLYLSTVRKHAQKSATDSTHHGYQFFQKRQVSKNKTTKNQNRFFLRTVTIINKCRITHPFSGLFNICTKITLIQTLLNIFFTPSYILFAQLNFCLALAYTVSVCIYHYDDQMSFEDSKIWHLQACEEIWMVLKRKVFGCLFFTKKKKYKSFLLITEVKVRFRYRHRTNWMH